MHRRNIGKAGAEAIARMLPDAPSLRTLGLSYADIGQRGAELIVAAVPQSSLKQLDGIMFNVHLKTLGLSQSLHLSSNDIIFKALEGRERAPSFSRRAEAEAEPTEAPAEPTEKRC